MIAKYHRENAEYETKIQRAFAFILRACAWSIIWLAIGESVTHIALDVLKMDVRPVVNSGRLNAVLGIITVVAGMYGGTKAAKGWMDFQREKHCTLRDPSMRTRKDDTSRPDNEENERQGA